MIFRSFSALALLVVPAAVTAAQTPARPAITGIAYVRFFESDLPAARVFYGQRLGLPETDEAGGTSTFAIGSQMVKIAPLPSAASRSRLDEVAFSTPDVRAMRRFLEAHAVAVEQPGANEIRVVDPMGTHIGFVQPGGEVGVAHSAATVTARRMIHAGWRVKDRAAEDAFYQGLLGFRPYWHGGSQPDRTDWVSLQVPEGTDWIEYMLEFHPDADRHELGVLDHISLGVNKITDATDRLIANGWTDASTRKSQIGKDGKWQLNVFDPDQTRVEFMEFEPVQKECCSAYTAKHPAKDPQP